MSIRSALALLFAVSLSLHAQRGGGMRAGGSGGMRIGVPSSVHTGGFGGGPHAGSPAGRRPGGFAPRTAPTFSRAYPGTQRSGLRYPGPRPTFYSRGYGNNYRRYGYGYGYPIFLNGGYGYPLYSSFLDNDPDLFWGDYNPNLTSSSGGYAESYAPQAPESQAYAPAPQAYDQTLAQPYPQDAWQPPYRTAPSYAAAASAAQAPEDATTLVFKDGRAPEQIRNYALSRTAIYITGAHIRQIPLDELDLSATVRANQDSATPFRVP